MFKTKGIYAIVVALVTLSGCVSSPTLSVSTPMQVIIKQSFGTPESTKPMADAECKKYNARNIAVFKTFIPDSVANGFAYDCVKT